MMEAVQEDIVIVGGGIAGLTTSLGLHRYPFSLCFHAYVLHVYIYIYVKVYNYNLRL
jgi:thioredoxin reductase